MDIRIAGVVKESIVDGPGLRYVVFTQGCPHHCEGCHNPETHDFAGGRIEQTEELIADMLKNPLLSGLTVSGGEPFAQPQPVLDLILRARQAGKKVMLFSGYTFEELLHQEHPSVREILANSDLLVDGRFVLAQRDLTLKFRGSRNQRIIDCAKSLEAGQAVEATL